MTNTIHTHATRAAIRDALFNLPADASNSATSHALLTRCGLVLLGRIKQAFVIKSRGGTDDAGERWAPLSPKTIAYSKTRSRGKGGRTRTERKRDTMPSQALNNKQQKRWWDLYRQGLAIFKGDKASAAKRAWAILKNEGAQTLLQKYGNRNVEILRDTGLLLNSLSPGVTSAEQIFKVGNGEVIVGTNRKGASDHHNGIPGRLPQRRLWPEPSKWPASWWRDITEEVKAGLIDLTVQLMKG